MRPLLALAAAIPLVAVGASAADTTAASESNAYAFEFHAQATALYTADGTPWTGPTFEEGQPVPLSQYAGHPILVVNTAAHCGFTPQFEGLEALWEQFRDQGLIMIGVHENDFADQGGTGEELAEECALRKVQFPQMQMAKTIGPDSDPFYVWVRSQLPSADMRATLEAMPAAFRGRIAPALADDITDDEVAEYGFPTWNFNKVLISADGDLLATFDSGDAQNRSAVQPELIDAIEAALSSS